MCERKLHRYERRKREGGKKIVLTPSCLLFPFSLQRSMMMMMMIDVCVYVYVYFSFANVPVGWRKIVLCYFNDNTNTRVEEEKESTIHCNVCSLERTLWEEITFIHTLWPSSTSMSARAWLTRRNIRWEKISFVWSIIRNEENVDFSREYRAWFDLMKRSRRRDPCHSIIDRECLSFIFNYIDKHLIHPE